MLPVYDIVSTPIVNRVPTTLPYLQLEVLPRNQMADRFCSLRVGHSVCTVPVFSHLEQGMFSHQCSQALRLARGLLI